MLTKTRDYEVSVKRDAQSGEFVALAREFPSLSWLARTPQLARRGLRHLLDEVIADMKRTGEPVPEPRPTTYKTHRSIVRMLR